MITHANVYEALGAAMAEVGHAEKRGRIVFKNGRSYNFASDADVVEAVRPAMVAHGLALVPARYTVTADTILEDGTRYVRLEAHFELVHASGPEQVIKVQTWGEGIDGGDKALSKAMTGAYKYALRQLFTLQIDDASDPDHHASPQQRQGPRQQQVRGDWPEWFVRQVQPKLAELDLSAEVLAPLFPKGMAITPQNVSGYKKKLENDGRDLPKEMVEFLEYDFPLDEQEEDDFAVMDDAMS
ncbi:MAG: ERF family protein [Myxococcota bacterium]